MANHFKSKNVLHNIVESQQTGQRLNLTSDFFNEIDKRLQFSGVPETLAKLEKCSSVVNFDAEVCIELLKELRLLLHAHATCPGEDDTQSIALCRAINDFQGPELMVRILCYEREYGFEHIHPRPTKETLQHLNSSALDLLHHVNCYNNNSARNLGLNDHFINQLFSFLKQKDIDIYASHLLDDILRARGDVISLNDINNLPELILQMSDHQLANFCRVLYFVLSDADAGEDRNTLLNQDTNKRLQERASVADNNQGILISIPDFLPRVSNLASESIDKSSPFVLGSPLAASRLQQFTSFFSGVLEDIADDDDDDGSSLLHSPFFSLSLKFIQDVMLKVEALFVLCVLLTGKYKTEVQEQLAALRLIPKLCIFFDELNWTENSEMSFNEDCHCAQETALKIQLLRLMHSFCDHHDKKYLLLTPGELNELKAIYEVNKHPIPEAMHNFDTRFCCDGEKGLLTKTLDVLTSVPNNSSSRFWLSRAIEGFLRGKASHADQMFLINRGLLKLLVNHICSKEMKKKEVIQSSFDLLGELMKFNFAAFTEFNNSITDAEFDRFVQVMTSNVIDSNMFMRCLILSYEHFATHREFIGPSRLAALISNWKQRVYLLHKLIMSVTVETLTQENVSCLNTSLVFLMFALNKGYLPVYLKAFRTEEAALKKPGLILDNLRCLLEFWKTHYLSRGKDCSALEQSSCISFQQWKAAVDMLLQEDISNPKAVVHYLSGKVDRNC